MDDAERYATVAAALAGHATLEEATAALRASAPGGRYRGALAAALVERLLPQRPEQLFSLYRDLDALLAIADADPPAAPSWRRIRAMARAATLSAAAAFQDVTDPGRALDEIDDLAAEVGEDDLQARAWINSALFALSMALGAGRDDPVQAEAWAVLRRNIDRGGAAAAPLGEVADALRDITADPAGPDLAGRVERLRRAVGTLPANSPARATFDDVVAQLEKFATDGPGFYHGSLNANQRALDHAVAAGPLIDPDGDPGRVDEGIERMRAALDGAAADHPQRVLLLTGLALAQLRRAEHTNDAAGLPEAEAVLAEARDLLRGPQDLHWSMVHDLLAEVRQRLYGGAHAYLDAVDALRTHVWQVLMQPTTAGAMAAAREAAESAVQAAHRCLGEGDAAGAVRALDAGRGLALYAATELGSIPDRLRADGQDELAGRWEQENADGEPPASLRRRVLDALTRAAPGGALFDPPATTDVRAALGVLDIDALVYLVPATGAWPGLAVAVPAAGPLAVLTLAGLRPADSPEVTEYLEGVRARDTAVVGRGPKRDLGSLDDRFSDELTAVCDWAWRAAMRAIVEKFVPSLRNRPTRRAPRLVLVPMGELGLIPWHAAGPVGGEPAIRSVAFSQAASARMLCHSASLGPAAPSRLGMVVGDPATGQGAVDLPGARAEAYGIWEVFYHRGRYLGRLPEGDGNSPSGAGAADEVRDWLTAAGRGAGDMLHLACHGVVQPGRSHLLLADGTELAAEELVRLGAGSRQRVVSLVVLAACSTGLSAGGYDEAYSLGTAFLAAGARSVLSTQWTIPDSGTSLLMFMFHHYLRSDRLPVWEALHRAQLWMLGPEREVPDSMPGSLREQLRDGRGDPADVTAWAGFLHGGW